MPLQTSIRATAADESSALTVLDRVQRTLRWAGRRERKVPRFVSPRRHPGSRTIAIACLWVGAALWLGLRGEHVGSDWFGAVTPRMSASGMTTLLAAVASGMIAFTGVVFSLALVGLQFGTSAYGPRIVGELGRGRLLAHAVGIFTGTFIYALLAIRVVDASASGGVPVFVAWMSLAWLLGSVLVAVLMLPRVTQMSLGHVLSEVGRRGREAAVRMYPLRYGEVAAPSSSRSMPTATRNLSVCRIITHHGRPAHVVGLDTSRLVAEARRGKGWVEIPHAIGDIVEPGDALAIFRGTHPAVSERRVRRSVWLSIERATDNDPAYALRLLVDTAIRALSPAINDPSTAVDVLDQIQAILSTMGRARLDTNTIEDSDDNVRVVFGSRTWDELVDLALSEIAQYGRESVTVQTRLRRLVEAVGRELDSSRREALETALVDSTQARSRAVSSVASSRPRK